MSVSDVFELTPYQLDGCWDYAIGDDEVRPNKVIPEGPVADG